MERAVPNSSSEGEEGGMLVVEGWRAAGRGGLKGAVLVMPPEEEDEACFGGIPGRCYWSSQGQSGCGER